MATGKYLFFTTCWVLITRKLPRFLDARSGTRSLNCTRLASDCANCFREQRDTDGRRITKPPTTLRCSSRATSLGSDLLEVRNWTHHEKWHDQDSRFSRSAHPSLALWLSYFRLSRGCLRTIPRLR